MTSDRELLISGDLSKFEWQFIKNTKSDIHLYSDALRNIP